MAIEGERPERLNLTNLQTGEGFFVQFNPTQLEREVQVAWSEQPILGQTYEPLDYGGTQNAKLSFDLYFQADNLAHQAGAEEVLRFLESLCYPPESADGIVGRRPPRVLVVWPKTVAFATVIKTLRVRHERFDATGRTIQWTARVEMIEARRSRLTQEFIRENGPRRASFGKEGG